jgi:predicted HTH transcriptional regulator
MNENHLRVFVSSVQRELEDERVTVQNLINTDSFLLKHCLSVLYEYEPASPDKALEGCLKSLDACDVYLLIVGSEYGSLVGDISITHAEYRRAKETRLPVLAFIKGDRRAKREDGTQELLKELDGDGFKYKRFGNVIELQKEVRSALVRLLEERFSIAPSSDEDQIAAQTIEATSSFETKLFPQVLWKHLDHDLARKLLAAAEKRAPEQIEAAELQAGASLRGLISLDADTGQYQATGAGMVLLAKDPSAALPQCRILCDAYPGTEPGSSSSDHEDIRVPAPQAVERAIAFVRRNTRHPMRVVGLNRVTLDEYPVEALREALVNAVAHRRYEDAGRKVMVEVFADRVVISSPGLPPSPITLASLRRGNYRPCSRNPVLAQCLSYFHRLEERGSGFRRMRQSMRDHGLEAPLLGSLDGYFEVIFKGPGNDLDRLTVPTSALLVTPAIEAQLSERQKKIMAQAVREGSVTTGWCIKELGVVRDTAHRDLVGLTEFGLLEAQGAGRSAKYVPKGGA